MRRSSIPWPPRPSALFALVGSLVVVAGCVTKGRYDGVVAANHDLQQRVGLLEASTRSLDAERAKRILDELE